MCVCMGRVCVCGRGKESRSSDVFLYFCGSLGIAMKGTDAGAILAGFKSWLYSL